jgi:5-methylthioadenosine/S-adenosylhomocysteine deaminase
MSALLIHRPTIITLNDEQEILPETSILVRDGKIASLIAADEPLPAADSIIEAQGQIALPGFVNCHTHAAMTLLRGCADDMELLPWLQEKIWPVEAKLQEEDVYWGTLLAIAEMIRAGVTCFNDMYFFLEAAVRACEQAGIRACLSGVVLGFRPQAEKELESAARFAASLKAKNSGLITPMLSPHAPYTCPDELMKKAIGFARETGVGIHIHLSESRKEVEESLSRHGLTPIAHMRKLGMFENAQVLSAHCVWPTQEDIEILAANKVGVAHCPGSNMKLACGAAPIAKMLASGVTLGLGTDGPASNNNLDLLEEARLAALLAKVSNSDPTAVKAYEALHMATRGGAQALSLDKVIGQIQPGFRADIILLDFNQPHLQPEHDLISHLIYSARAADVRTLLVEGKPLMLDRVLQTLNEEEIIAQAGASAKRLVA